jgi:hypothetical protein
MAKKTINTSVLAIYLLIGVIGNLDNFSPFCRSDVIHQIKDTPNHINCRYKAFWTQHNHIFSEVKLSAHTPASFTMPKVPIYSIVYMQVESGILFPPSFSKYSSRAPPQI